MKTLLTILLGKAEDRYENLMLMLCVVVLLLMMLLGSMTAVAQITPMPPSDRVGQVTSLLDDEAIPSDRIYAIGRASIFNNDLQDARRRALQVAYAEAVAQGAGIEVGSLTLIRNVQQVTDVVTTRSRGMITAYEVVQETISDDLSEFTVGIEAEVARTTELNGNQQNEALRLYLAILGNPRVLVLVPQIDMNPGMQQTGAATTDINIQTDSGTRRVSASQSVSANTLDYFNANAQRTPLGVLRGTDAAFVQSLGQAGYDTLTIDMVAGQVGQELVDRARAGDTQAAITVARQVGAELVMVGTLGLSARRISPQGVTFESVSAELSARVLVSSTGEVVDTLYFNSTRAHSNVLAAVGEIRNDLAEQVTERLRWEIPQILSNSPHVFRLIVRDLPPNDLISMSNSIRNGFELESVSVTRLPSEVTNEGEIELRTGFIKIPGSELYTHILNNSMRDISLIEQDAFSMTLEFSQ